MPESDPYRAALDAVLPADLREEMARAEARLAADLEDAAAAKGRALEQFRARPVGRPFEAMEFDLEREYDARVRYHRAKFTKRVRWVLEAWKATPGE